MGWIPVLFAHKVIALAGPDAGAPAPQGPADPHRMMPDTEFFDLLERVAKLDGGRSIPLRVGASMRCDDYGAFGLAFKSAVDLGGAYHRVERYGRIVTSIANFRVVPGAEHTLFEVIPGSDDRLGARLTHELALAAAMALSREVCTRAFVPVAVHIARPAPPDRSSFDGHFRCPIRFEAEHDALEVTAEQLSHPNRLGDASISRFFDTHLDQALADLPAHGELIHRVRAAISPALSEGVPTLPRMARQLGMSRRTLQRRLAEAGISYQALVADVRQSLAQQLLRGSACSLVEVAFLTGFSDQSTFSRAFKRWSGHTPQAYRRLTRG